MGEDPHGAARAGHALLVHWSHGVRRFSDRPPYDASLDGLHWTYCGFSHELSMHLIGEQNGGLFTGVLLDDKTGSVLPAGEDVWFSPNRLYYLASEQPDGQDGPTLSVHAIDGRSVWKGYGGILEPNGVGVLADFVRAGWNDQNQVTMEVSLPDGRRRTVTLTRVGNSWQWLPKLSRWSPFH